MKYVTVPHINTPTYHLLEKYGYPVGTVGIGINKIYIDRAISENIDLKVSYGKSKDKYLLKRSQTQNLPVQRGFQGKVDIMQVPVNILGKSAKQKKYEEASKKYYSLSAKDQVEFLARQ